MNPDVRCALFGHDRYTTATVDDGGYLVYRCERCGQAILVPDDAPPFEV